MVPDRINGILEGYERETWGNQKAKTALINRFRIQRVCSLDTWTLYLLAESSKLDELEGMDKVYITHCTIFHILEELSSCPNHALRRALDYIGTHDNICIHSSDFASQLKVRNRLPLYDEPASAVAIAWRRTASPSSVTRI